MAWFSWFNKKPKQQQTYENTLDLMQGEDWFNAGFFANNDSVSNVSPDKAMQHSAVYACVRVVSQIIGSLRVDIVDASTDEKQQGYYLGKFLDIAPNDAVTARDLWEQVVIDMLLFGRSFVRIVRNKRGDVVGLVRLDDSQVKVKKTTGVLPKLFYEVQSINGKVETLPAWEMLHFRYFGSRSYLGESPIQIAGRSIVAGNTEEVFSQKYFNSGGQLKDVVEFPSGIQIDPDAEKRFKSSFDDNKIDQVLIVKNGGKHKRVAMSAQDAQTLESRKFSVEQICRLFGVPMFLVGSLEKTTSFGKGVGEQYAFFNRLTLNPLIQKVETEIRVKLFDDLDGLFEARFDREGLMKGDLETMAKADQIALGGNQMQGNMTVNEVRRRKGLPPLSDKRAEKVYFPPENLDNRLKPEKQKDDKSDE